MLPVLEMIRKEFRQIFRDRPMVAIIFLVPIVQLLILSYAITTEVKHIKLAVIDYDRSQLSREIISSFANTERFDLVTIEDDLHDVDYQMKAWKIQMALVIPKNFHRDVQRRLHPQIFLAADGVDGNTASVAMGYAQAILLNFGIDLSMKNLTPQGTSSVHLISMSERMWYNIELNSQQYMVPGIVVILLTIIPMMLSAMSLVKEKESGTLEQLMVTPLHKYQLLLGKIIPFLILAYIEMGIVMTAAITIFGITVEGSYLLLAVLSLLYLLTTIGLGIFISTFTNTQQQAMFVAWFFMVFMIIMSSFFIPIQNMPPVLKGLTYLNPMRYIMAIIRDIFQKGSDLRTLWIDTILMTSQGLMIISLAVVKFQKRIT